MFVIVHLFVISVRTPMHGMKHMRVGVGTVRRRYWGWFHRKVECLRINEVHHAGDGLEGVVDDPLQEPTNIRW